MTYEEALEHLKKVVERNEASQWPGFEPEDLQAVIIVLLEHEKAR